MKKILILVIVIMLCTLFVACENASTKDNDSKSIYTGPDNTTQKNVNTKQKNDNTDTDSESQKTEDSNQQKNNSDADSVDDSKLPEYTAPDKKSDDIGSITVDLNGSSKTYKATLAFDDSIDGTWIDICGKSDKILIQLPSDVETGNEYTIEDGQMSTTSFGPPEFSFVYTDKSGNAYALYDATNEYDSFGLIIDKWEGHGGYAEGRFVAEIRPLGADTIIMKNGRFKVKIRD